MTCSKCGKTTTGKFCGDCGSPTGEGPVEGVTETVAVPVRETFFPVTPSQPPASLGGLRSVLSKLRGLKRGPAVGLIVMAAVVIAAIGAGLTSLGPDASSNSPSNDSTTINTNTSDAMYQMGFREATNSPVAGPPDGPGPVCRALVEVSKTSDPNWATETGKQAYYEGCVAGYNK
jgi:hypothetical protein